MFSLVTRGLAWISSVIMPDWPDWHIITVDAMQLSQTSTPVRKACFLFLMGNSMFLGLQLCFKGTAGIYIYKYNESPFIQIESHVTSIKKEPQKKDQKGSLYRKET